MLFRSNKREYSIKYNKFGRNQHHTLALSAMETSIAVFTDNWMDCTIFDYSCRCDIQLFCEAANGCSLRAFASFSERTSNSDTRFVLLWDASDIETLGAIAETVVAASVYRGHLEQCCRSFSLVCRPPFHKRSECFTVWLQ